MNLLADESVDGPIVTRLRHEGHHVIYVAEMSPGIDDVEVLRQANDQGALLLTADKDFGELVFRQGRVTSGVILIRLAGLSAASKAEVVARLFQDHAADLPKSFCVVTAGGARIRKEPD